MNTSRLKKFLPLLLSLAVICGFLLGINLNFNKSSNTPIINLKSDKFNLLTEIIDYVDKDYVDSINKQDIINNTIDYLLSELDPHSYFISADELAAMNEPLQGNFEGIGVQFNIQKDTIVIVTPLSGGPSEKVGIKAGDRIVKVNGELIAGTGVTNADVLKKLKGKKGTKVEIEIIRKNNPDLLAFTVTRDKIPLYSVDVSYSLNEETGFIKITRFAKTTFQEFIQACEKLKSKGIENIVVDLRGNGGGYLNAAVNISDQFLDKGNLIVYTEGKSRAKKNYYATSKTYLEGMKVAVLIDGSSASASEILAGAIQDNDRGWIIGRRSFGKGLVQEQVDWPDGSATRLTTARYYTPTGRCIQKPYGDNSEDYHNEYYKRYQAGELLTKDSIKTTDSLAFTTPKGRIVYGGGGITPDYFIPIDTTSGSSYLNALLYGGIIYDYAFDFTDGLQEKLIEQYQTPENFNKTFKLSESLWKDFIDYAEKNKVKYDKKGLKRSKDHIEKRIKSYIARNLWNSEGFYYIWNLDDPAIQKALSVLEQSS